MGDQAINPLAKPVITRLSGVLDSVHEKLASLREKERKIVELTRRKRKQHDPVVDEELLAMASSDFNIFGGIKPAMPARPEKPPRRMKEIFQMDEPRPKSTKTYEERYRILDARDKKIQARRDQAPGKGRKLVGTCPDMCPEKERMRRCYQSQLSPFEMMDYPHNVEMREEWMVKEYARSSADQDTPLPHDLRPVPVLQRTMEHLCRNIADRSEGSDEILEDWYMFMWDRTRAIRKDLTHQDTCSTAAVNLLEQCARFHIHCAERLIDQDSSIYDDKINTENLTKCLQTLKYMYNDLRTVGVVCPNVSEFMCYSLLLNLNNPSIMAEIRDMPEDVMTSEPIHFALDIITARVTKNYIKFFQLVKKTSYLNCCLLRRYFSEVRVNALSTMVRAYSSKRLLSTTVPLMPLVESLMFENIQDCLNHLRLCNLRYDQEEGYAVLDRKQFQGPQMAFPLFPSVLYIQAKKKVALSEIIWGGPLSDDATTQPVHSSFDASGELKHETILIEDDEDEEENLANEIFIGDEDEEEEEEQYVDESEQDVIEDDIGEEFYEEEIEDEEEEENEENIEPVFNFSHSPSIFAAPASTIPMFGKEMISPFSFGNVASLPVAEPKKIPPPVSLPTSEILFKPFKPKPESPKAEREQDILKQKEAERKQREEEQRAKDLRESREREEIRRAKEIQLEKDKQMAERLKNEEIKKVQELEKARLAEIELRNRKLKKLKDKYRWWKIGVFARTWRQKAWQLAEHKKVQKYFNSILEKYPPVCGPELLDGNPFQLIIPNSLLLQPRSFRTFDLTPKSRLSKSGPPPILPLVHMGRAVGPALQAQVQKLYPDPVTSFRSRFPWKLVLCLPDELETNVRLDTFLEMHFVDNFNWKFGIEAGPLVSCTYSIGTLQLIISVRRIKGLEMLEGSEPNPNAVIGANSLLFFLTDDFKKISIFKERLSKIRNISGGKNIPVVAFVFGERFSEATVRSLLSLDNNSRVVTCSGASQQSLVTTLSHSLSLAADITGKVPSVRSVKLDSAFNMLINDQIWRRIEIALINFDIITKEPESLIIYYNQCIENLITTLLDPKLDQEAHLATEFESILSQIEKPLKFCSRPQRNADYSKRLKEYFNKLKLPKWPKGISKSTQELNFKLHNYAKSIVNRNKIDQKNLKWRIYCIIQKTLLWKGLDIYCDEDVNLVLEKFPWVAVFRQYAQKRMEITLTDLTVTYDQSKIQDFCYDPSLSQLLSQSEETFDLNETRPVPEKDGIVFAYTKAIARQKIEEEENARYRPSISEQVAEAFEKSMAVDVEESPSHETSSLKRSFNELEDKIADMTAKLEKRRKVIEEIIDSNLPMKI